MRTQALIGSVVGGYRLEEQIGSGGTSAVFRGRHVRLGRPAAVKLLGTGFGEADFGERFLRESRRVGSIAPETAITRFTWSS